MSKRQHCFTTLTISLIMFLYFSASFVFELLDPVLTYTYEKDTSRRDWQDLFYRLYYLRFMFDFVSCTLILCLLYRFGPA
mmetsp:Transcript_24241/g.28415  ORF Transcript_24241/g.28415 Transcript_24241/m.28415 type:complete len:80 (+) Transcript_24241:392-631(+)